MAAATVEGEGEGATDGHCAGVENILFGQAGPVPLPEGADPGDRQDPGGTGRRGERRPPRTSEAAATAPTNSGLLTLSCRPRRPSTSPRSTRPNIYLTLVSRDYEPKPQSADRPDKPAPGRGPLGADPLRTRRRRQRAVTNYLDDLPGVGRRARCDDPTEDSTRRRRGRPVHPQPAGHAARRAGRRATPRSRPSPRSIGPDPVVVVLGPSCAGAPGLMGAEELLRQRPDVGAILIAEELTTDVFQRAIRSGVRDVLAAPVDTAQLGEAVRRVEEAIGAHRVRRLAEVADRVGRHPRPGHHRLLDQGRRRQVGGRQQPRRVARHAHRQAGRPGRRRPPVR